MRIAPLLPLLALSLLAPIGAVHGEDQPRPEVCSRWLFEPIALLDEPYRVAVETNDSPANLITDREDWTTDTPEQLFADIEDPGSIDPSYVESCLLCEIIHWDPEDRPVEDLDGAIRGYLRQVAQMAPLQYALAVTETDEDDLYDTWFGAGKGFEHVICGEKDPVDPTNVGGYHFWYMFYFAERLGIPDGRVNFRGSLEGETDPAIATIRFDWNPPGEGAYRRKPIGGFTVGNSVAAMLALGHLALHRECDVAEWENDFVADINGTAYEWVLVTKEGSVLSLYPKALDQTLGRDGRLAYCEYNVATEVPVMRKHLVKHGNSWALVIDKPILQLMHLEPETDEIDMSLTGDQLLISPANGESRAGRIRAAALEFTEQYSGMLKKLAE